MKNMTWLHEILSPVFHLILFNQTQNNLGFCALWYISLDHTYRQYLLYSTTGQK